MAPVTNRPHTPHPPVRLPLFGIHDENETPHILLQGLRLFDGKEDRLREDVVVLLHGERIHAVERAADTGKAEGYRRIDLGGLTLLPGLIDAHCHLTVPFMYEVSLGMLLQTGRQIAKNLEACVMSGVTTVRDLGGFPRRLLDLREQTHRGHVRGPRIVTSLSPIAARHDGEMGAPENAPYFTNPLVTKILGGNFAERPRNTAEAREACERMLALGADWLKTLHQEHSYSQVPRVLPNHSEETFRAIVSIARDYGVPCAMHQTLVSGFVKGVELGFDTLEHIPLDAQLSQHQVEAFVTRGTAIVPTLMAVGDILEEEELLATIEAPGQTHLVPEAVRQVSVRIRDSLSQKGKELSLDERRRLQFDRRYFETSFPVAVQNLLALHRMGATIGLGTDCGGTFTGLFGRYARELRYYVEAGLSPFETLRIATEGNARILRLQDSVGTIVPGKRADVIAVEGDPLRDIRAMERVRLVIKDGAVLRADGMPSA